MKKIQPNGACLKALLFAACALLLIPITNLSAAPSVYQEQFGLEDCYTPEGNLVSNCAPLIALLDAQATDPLVATETVYFTPGSFVTGSDYACITAPDGFVPLSDHGITAGSYDTLMNSDLLSALNFVVGGESISQTNPVRENDLTTTPTVCTRKDDTILDTYYMAVFPPMLGPDPLMMTVGSYAPTNTAIPTTPAEVTCLGSETYGDCEAKALVAYTQVYGLSAVPLLVSTEPEDNDEAVDPNTTMFTLTFNEPIAPGIVADGSGYLKKLSDGSVVETFSPIGSNVALDATGETLSVTLSNPLEAGTDYYIQIDMGIIGSQATSNSYAGITFNDTWNFTTNSYPVLADASVTGAPIVLSTLTAVPGTFSDPDLGDTAGPNMFQWFSGTDNTCNSHANPIAGATTSTYSPVAADVGKFICVAVAPKDNHGLLGEAVFASTSLAIVKAAQTITFNDPVDLTYSPGLTFGAPATSSSALTVDLAVDLTTSSPGVCSVSGNVVTVLSVGNCDLITSQVGDASYGPAASQRQTVVISQSEQTVTFADPADVVYAPGLTFDAPASSSSGLPVTLRVVNLTSSTDIVCSVSGNTVTVLSAGNCDLVASQQGDVNYKPAADVGQRVIMSKAAQTVTFADPVDVTYSPGLTFSAPASSTSGLAVTVGSTTTGICTIAGNTVTVLSGGVCNLVATQNGDTNYQAATAVIQSVTISQAVQTVTFIDPADVTYSPGLTFAAPATSDSGLPVTVSSASMSVCTVSGSTVTVISAGSCDLVATQSGNVNYQAASVSQTVAIAQAVQALVFEEPENAASLGGSATYTGLIGGVFNAPFSVDSGLSLTVSSSTPAVCTVSGNIVTIVNAGTCNLSATQAGNVNYAPVTISRSINISTTVDVTGVTETGGGGSATLLELLLGFGLVALIYRRKMVSSIGGVK